MSAGVSDPGPLLAQYHSPSWTRFLACDEAAWSQVESHIGFTFETVTHGSQLLAATDLEAKTTYVRGWALIHPFSDDIVAQPRHIVAHELGHITLNTHNEAKAEKQCMVLLNEPMLRALFRSVHDQFSRNGSGSQGAGVWSSKRPLKARTAIDDRQWP